MGMGRDFRTVFLGGLRSALHLRVLLPLYVSNLLIGLIQTWPLVDGVTGGGLYSTFLSNLVTGGTDAFVQLILGNARAPIFTVIWGVLLLLLTALFWLLYCFFTGGVLSTWLNDGLGEGYPSAPSRGLSYLNACRRYFWSFVGLGTLLLIILGFCLTVVGILSRLVGSIPGTILAFLALALINMVGEYGRAIAVARDIRNPIRLLGGAVRFCIGHLPGVVLLTICGLALRFAVIAAGVVVARQFGASPAVVVWQQIVLIVSLWGKFLLLAWALQYVAIFTPASAPTPVDEPALST